MKYTVITMLLMLFSVSACNSTATENKNINQMEEDTLLKLVKDNDLKAVSEALEKGADVNLMDDDNRSLLLLATIRGYNQMAKLLVEYNADVNLQSDNLDSPFLYAGASGQVELVKLFLENGARFDIFNRYYGSALIPACERGHVETVELLANTKGYPIDHINNLGWTALMEAVVLGDGSKPYQEIVQILKDAGAKMDIPDKNGVTPLQHAERSGYKEIVAIIKS